MKKTLLIGIISLISVLALQAQSRLAVWCHGVPTYYNISDVDSIVFENSVVPQYGQPCPGTPTLTDIDGNVYNTVQIGQQCWMKENLRTTKYADNTPVPSGDTYSSTLPYRYAPNDDEGNVPVYGYLYNWKAVMRNSSSSSSNPSGVQGICPTGWHVPSDAEWTQLTSYVSSQSQYVCGSGNSYIAKALASDHGWQITADNVCAVGYDQSSNNVTGFSALPAGLYSGSYDFFGLDAYFWSAAEHNGNLAYERELYYDNAYVGRNYAGKSYGFSVRCVKDEGGSSASHLPTITTSSVTNITSTTATSGGNVTFNGGATVTVRGVCWSTTPNPTVADSHTTDGTGTGSFASSLTGLTSGTTYYVRAYATNSVGTAYGEEVSFTTETQQYGQPCPGTPTLTDIDGNVYNTVQIGQQCWMKENLRTTKYADNTSISQGSSTSTTTGYWYYPDNDVSYGLLYNWKAVMRNSSSSSANPSGVQGICPTGWHVPSDAEFTQLTDYVSSQSQYVCGSNNTYIAKALASDHGWQITADVCAVGYDQSSNNVTGFSALPAGVYGVSYVTFGFTANFWSATEDNDDFAYYRVLPYLHAYVSRNYYAKYYGFSVRCVKDEGGSSASHLPTITTSSVTNITFTTATSGGNVTFDGGATVTVRGVCWSTTPNPTVADSHTTDGTGTGSFTSSLTGLSALTTYYVRAYATNSVGTAYGEEVSFTTETQQDGQPCPGTPTLTDIDGNVYNTVQIRQQCWMKENLRTTKYADNTPIPLGETVSTTNPYRYAPNDDEGNVPVYGYLYNWKAVMRNSSSSSANPSGVQGICPTGWHVPSDAEFTQLTDYVSSQSQYVCGSNNTYIAKALASDHGWQITADNVCAVGYDQSSNNVTGFSALPAGFYVGSYYYFGYYADFWSATEINDDRAYYRTLYYVYAYVDRSGNYKDDGFSVRCLRD